MTHHERRTGTADLASPSSDLVLPPGSSRIRQTAHEYVRETLRQAILSGELPGGTRLVQAELAKELKVSITPVREALRDLSAEQLIHLDPHRGGIVHELTDGDLQEILDLRMLLELEVMRRAAERITLAQLEQAQDIHEAMVLATHSAMWVTLNRDFHFTIYEAGGSPRLLGIVRNLLDASMMYVNATDEMMPQHRERAGRDHAAMLQMLRDHDVEGAVLSLKGHMTIPRSVLRLRS